MSEVTICNLALSHLGDTATVMSIKPPDSSIQAQLCARFYPIARNALLEMSSWGFATRRVALAQVANPTIGSNGTGTWLYAYALPDAMINALAVLPANAADDYQARFGYFGPDVQNGSVACVPGSLPGPMVPYDEPQPFALETNTDGSQIVLTNVVDAVMRYTTLVDDTTKFSPLFVLALSHLLASMLAGPILKGDAGAAEAARQLTIFKSFEGLAEASDANQRKTNVNASPCWIRGR